MKKTQTTQEVQEPSIEKEVQEVQKNAPDQAAQTPAREYLRKKYTPEEMEQGHCAATAQKTLEEIGIEKLQEIQRQAGEAAKMTDHTPDNPEYNPKTDPNNPLFDIEEWKKAAINELLETLNYTVKSAQEGTTTAVKHAAAMTPIITNAINAILQTAQTDTDAIKKEIFSLLEIIRENQELFDNIAQDLEELEQLKPYIEAELEEFKKEDSQYSWLTLDDIINSDDDNSPLGTISTQIIEKAKRKKETEDSGTKSVAENVPNTQQAAELLNIQYKKTTDFMMSTDYLTRIFFSPDSFPPDETHQLSYAIKRSKKNKEITTIPVFYSYTFDESIMKDNGLEKNFDAFDLFVITVLDNLYAAGNNTVSVTKIYHEMGGKGNPGSKHLEPIYNTLAKAQATIITIDDNEVQKAWGKPTHKQYRGPVMQISIIAEKYKASGKISDIQVKIYDYSPFMRIAKPLGHIEGWSKKILQLYSGRKTKRYHSVLQYLMSEIAWMRKPNSKRKKMITYRDLYKKTGANTAREQQLTKDMMYRILDDVFIKAGYVISHCDTKKGDPAPGVKLTVKEKQ